MNRDTKIIIVLLILLLLICGCQRAETVEKPPDPPQIYVIVEDSQRERFMNKVNTKITEGYAPLGGVSYISSWYVQALIKEKP